MSTNVDDMALYVHNGRQVVQLLLKGGPDCAITNSGIGLALYPNMQNFFSAVWALTFWSFIAIKVGGASLASWSWWWVLLPQVPVFALAARMLNL